ncbi:MAG: negative regulator of sigma E activity [Saprospiraceae bacterium]|jgi:negative regulator of sigma E activity
MKQEISELLDGELTAAESALAIARLSADKSSEQQWQKMCITRAVMRGEYVAPARANHLFADKLALQLESEPVILAPNNLLGVADIESNTDFTGVKSNVATFPQRSGNTAKLGMLAVAASFFAVTLFNLNPFDTPSNDGSNQIVETQNTDPNKTAQFLAAEQELQALVVAHGEFSSMAGLNGLAAYAKIVNADGAQ